MRTKVLQTFKCVISHKYFPIIALICVNMIIGALIIADYGESWDEHLRYRYGQNSINAYLGIPGDLKDDKGPFFVMLATLVSNFIYSVRQDWLIGDIRHYINFLSFLLGLFFIYRLNCRFTNKWAAFGGALLFNTQPLLWGHAFINPKDIPFMAFFIASIDTGLAMVDSHHRTHDGQKTNSRNPILRILPSQFKEEWKLTPQPKQRVFATIILISLITIIGIFVTQDWIQNIIESKIQEVYTNNTSTFLASIFARVAQNMDDVPVESYVQKTLILYSRSTKYVIFSILVICITVTYRLFPETRKFLLHHTIIGAIWKNLKNPAVMTAGIFLGLTCSIRTLGQAAGGLTGLYLLAKHKKDSFSILWAYMIISVVVTYITWPALWNSPINNFFRSFSTSSNFLWGGKLLFAGNSYLIGTHPRSYLPVLLSIQLTVTALIPFVLGLVSAIPKSIKGNLDWMKITVIALWFFVPVSLVIIVEPKIYDNFRHFLFFIPPLFTFAAIGLQSVFDVFKRPIIQAIILLILILPNIFSLVNLHPYQYVYYNAFTDGVGGAFRQFEMDYWAISYREATEYINQNAPPNSKVIVYGPIHIVKTYARPDLEIIRYRKSGEIDDTSPIFAIILSRYDKDIHLFPDAEDIFIVGKENAVFTVVKMLNSGNTAAP